MTLKNKYTAIFNKFKETNSAFDEVIGKIQSKSYILDGCKNLNFKESSHIEYVEDVFVQDLSNSGLSMLGISIFYISVHKTTSSPIHVHNKQAQLVYVKEGAIFDKVSKIKFIKGESFFISKRNSHSLKYLKGSKLIIVYLPGLDVEKD